MRGKNFKAYELGKINLSCSVLPQCGYGQSSITIHVNINAKKSEVSGRKVLKVCLFISPYLSGKDSLAGRLVLSLEWWAELTRHKFRGPCHKLCIELGPGSAPFRRKRRCTLHANTLQSA